VELLRELEVDVGEVDEDGDGGKLSADGALEFLKFAIDAGQMLDDLGDAHNRHVFRSHDLTKSGLDHARTTHADEAGVAAFRGELAAQLFDQHGAVELAAGFPGGDEDGGLGHSCASSRAGTMIKG